jgi:3-methyl-2-oxobutanoate hydroxymethyltransferase
MSSIRKPEKQVRITDLLARKTRGPKIAVLTAYDAAMGRLLDEAGMDVVLVGDSLGMVVLGYDTTIPVTMDDMVHHTRAVRRGVRRALLVADMPFLSYQVETAEAVRNAGRLMQEAGAAAVKLEGGAAVAGLISKLVEIGIPVMGHVGLTPQSVHQLGGFRRVGVTEAEHDRVLEDARAVAKAGAFSIVLESIPHDLAAVITREIDIPTIGIGAGPDCDGQVLVSYDMLGLGGYAPPFVRQYADLGTAVIQAAAEYIADVRSGRFPETAAPPAGAKKK